MAFSRFGWRFILLTIALCVGFYGLTLTIGAIVDLTTPAFAQDLEDDDEEEEDDETPDVPIVVPEDAIDQCPPGLVRVNFNDIDIKDIVKTMATMTGQNFMLDDGIAGKITIISPTCVTTAEAYDVFQSVLYVHGMTTLKIGKLNKIIKRENAQSAPIQTNTDGLGRDNEKYVTQLIPLQNINAVEIATAFRSLVSGDGNIFAYGPSNILIVLDSAANINRLFRIIQKLDVEGTEKMLEVIPIEYASADALAGVIEQLLEEEASSTSASGGASRASALRQRLAARRRGSAASRRIAKSAMGGAQSIAAGVEMRIIPDMRTNSLVVKANKYTLRRIREVVKRLDQPLPGGEGKIHVMYLENADAQEMAAVLADLAGSGGGGSGSINNSRSRNSRGSTASSAANSFSSRFGGNSRMSGNSAMAGRLGGASAMGGRGSSGLNRDAGNPTRGIAQTSGRFLADFDGAVRITSDPATNSLVIIASNRDMAILREVINKLDIPRPQVYVEVLIAEITAQRGVEVGFEFRSTNDPGAEGVQVLGGTNYGGIQNAAVNPLGVSGFAVGAADGTIEFAGETFSNIGALFRAMQTDRDVNIMATPHILTTDNESAEIVIADNIPFVTGQIFSNTFNNPTTTVERQDVGITLQITPSINESDMVRLTLYTESSSVTDSPAGLSASQVGITTAKRSADSVVVVQSRQTVIIGGLMKDNIAYIESKVPILGDIPVLGYLFKSSKRSIEKTNLLIFITPYIIKDNGDLEEVTRQANYRLQRFRQENRLQRRRDLNEGQMAPTERVFRRQDPNAIEVDPTLRGTSVREEDPSGTGPVILEGNNPEDIGQPYVGDDEDEDDGAGDTGESSDDGDSEFAPGE
jgi:general secretion pathway protein D